jgi:hypothetical protein
MKSELPRAGQRPCQTGWVLVAILAGTIALAGCGLGDHNERFGDALGLPGSQAGRAGDASRSPAGTGEELDLTPKAPLDPGEKLIQVINTNLDLDANDEQILVVRKKDDPDAPLKIVVIDYDPVRASYARSWESLTDATNLRLFEVSLKDLVGDHNQEIVCRGINARGEQTLNVFRKAPSPAGLGLYFADILRIVSDGSIEIEEIERPESYRLGQKNGPSFSIYSFSQDRESDNILDRIKRTYHWQYQQNRYVLTKTEKLPGAVVAERQLQELFHDPSVSAFEEFLAGPWYLSDTEGREEILLFLPDERRISIYTGQVQETYIWQASFRSLSNRLLIFGANESIESVTKRFSVDVVSLNTIDVSIWGAEEWDRAAGRYMKLTEELQGSLLVKDRPRARPGTLQLRGLYQSGAGIRLIFEPPNFTWIDENHSFSGGFSIFALDHDVLYLQGMDENGLSTETATYIMEYSEKKEGEYLYRNLVLTPGKIGVRGIEPIAETRLTFEQMETPEDKSNTPNQSPGGGQVETQTKSR